MTAEIYAMPERRLAPREDGIEIPDNPAQIYYELPDTYTYSRFLDELTDSPNAHEYMRRLHLASKLGHSSTIMDVFSEIAEVIGNTPDAAAEWEYTHGDYDNG